MKTFSYAVFKVVSLNTWETNIINDGTITYHDLFPAILQSTLENALQWRSKLDNWGGHIFIYSYSAQLISFEIDCFHGL